MGNVEMVARTRKARSQLYLAHHFKFPETDSPPPLHVIWGRPPSPKVGNWHTQWLKITTEPNEHGKKARLCNSVWSCDTQG